MDGHTSESLCVLKNDMIEKMQTMFYEYTRMHEVVLQKQTEEDLEKRQMMDTIRSMQEQEQIRLTTIQCLESDLLKCQQTNHEYAEMIKSFEQKLADKDKDTESDNKFSMIPNGHRSVWSQTFLPGSKISTGGSSGTPFCIPFNQ